MMPLGSGSAGLSTITLAPSTRGTLWQSRSARPGRRGGGRSRPHRPRPASAAPRPVPAISSPPAGEQVLGPAGVGSSSHRQPPRSSPTPSSAPAAAPGDGSDRTPPAARSAGTTNRTARSPRPIGRPRRRVRRQIRRPQHRDPLLEHRQPAPPSAWPASPSTLPDRQLDRIDRRPAAPGDTVAGRPEPNAAAPCSARPPTAAIALIASDRRNRRISAQSSTVITLHKVTQGVRFQRRLRVEFSPAADNDGVDGG